MKKINIFLICVASFIFAGSIVYASNLTSGISVNILDSGSTLVWQGQTQGTWRIDVGPTMEEDNAYFYYNTMAKQNKYVIINPTVSGGFVNLWYNCQGSNSCYFPNGTVDIKRDGSNTIVNIPEFYLAAGYDPVIIPLPQKTLNASDQKIVIALNNSINACTKTISVDNLNINKTNTAITNQNKAISNTNIAINNTYKSISNTYTAINNTYSRIEQLKQQIITLQASIPVYQSRITTYNGNIVTYQNNIVNYQKNILKYQNSIVLYSNQISLCNQNILVAQNQIQKIYCG